MEKAELKKALQEIRASKRNFNQTVDFVVNLRGVDLKKTENQIDLFVQLHNTMGKPMKVCALIGPELKDEATKSVDGVVMASDFESYANDKKKTKKLADDYDYFVGQANIMPKIASTFGRVLGSRGKMPNPKAGCIVPPNANLKQLHDKLQKTIRLRAKTSPVIHTIVGKQDMEDDEIIDNIQTIYTTLVHRLPNAEHNIKSAYLKLTMGTPVKVK